MSDELASIVLDRLKDDQLIGVAHDVSVSGPVRRLGSKELFELNVGHCDTYSMAPIVVLLTLQCGETLIELSLLPDVAQELGRQLLVAGKRIK